MDTKNRKKYNPDEKKDLKSKKQFWRERRIIRRRNHLKKREEKKRITPLSKKLIILKKHSETRKKRIRTSKSLKKNINFYIKDKNYDTVIFSKSYCPYCMNAKKLLSQISKNRIKIVELDKIPEGEDLQTDCYHKTNQKTVPNVFINGKHIGGYDNLSQLGVDKIQQLINKKQNMGGQNLNSKQEEGEQQGDEGKKEEDEDEGEQPEDGIEEEQPEDEIEEEQPGIEEEQPGIEEEQTGIKEEQPGIEEEQTGIKEEQTGIKEEQTEDGIEGEKKNINWIASVNNIIFIQEVLPWEICIENQYLSTIFNKHRQISLKFGKHSSGKYILSFYETLNEQNTIFSLEIIDFEDNLFRRGFFFVEARQDAYLFKKRIPISIVFSSEYGYNIDNLSLLQKLSIKKDITINYILLLNGIPFIKINDNHFLNKIGMDTTMFIDFYAYYPSKLEEHIYELIAKINNTWNNGISKKQHIQQRERFMHLYPRTRLLFEQETIRYDIDIILEFIFKLSQDYQPQLHIFANNGLQKIDEMLQKPLEQICNSLLFQNYVQTNKVKKSFFDEDEQKSLWIPINIDSIYSSNNNINFDWNRNKETDMKMSYMIAFHFEHHKSQQLLSSIFKKEIVPFTKEYIIIVFKSDNLKLSFSENDICFVLCKHCLSWNIIDSKTGDLYPVRIDYGCYPHKKIHPILYCHTMKPLHLLKNLNITIWENGYSTFYSLYNIITIMYNCITNELIKRKLFSQKKDISLSISSSSEKLSQEESIPKSTLLKETNKLSQTEFKIISAILKWGYKYDGMTSLYNIFCL